MHSHLLALVGRQHFIATYQVASGQSEPLYGTNKHKIVFSCREIDFLVLHVLRVDFFKQISRFLFTIAKWFLL